MSMLIMPETVFAGTRIVCELLRRDLNAFGHAMEFHSQVLPRSCDSGRAAADRVAVGPVDAPQPEDVADAATDRLPAESKRHAGMGSAASTAGGVAAPAPSGAGRPASAAKLFVASAFVRQADRTGAGRLSTRASR